MTVETRRGIEADMRVSRFTAKDVKASEDVGASTNLLRRQECGRDLGTVIHFNRNGDVVVHAEGKVSKTRAEHGILRSISTVQVQRCR